MRSSDQGRVDARVIKITVPSSQLKRQQMGNNCSKSVGKVTFIAELRNDNCVKNHFYSKLRKSLRTINKIVKLYLKKEAK